MVSVKKNILFILLLLTIAGFFQSCYAPDEGALSEKNRTELKNFAAKSVSIEKKYIKLMQNMVLLLEEVRDIPEDDMAMDRLRRFYEDDKYALKQIGREINGWYQYATQEDITNFLVAIKEDPSSNKLSTLIPTTRNRIKYNVGWEEEFNLLVSYLNLER
ncbi:MAG: hypothetical protein MRZ79_18825 [Bacteroidia bacterium]|nr:hypothetical protein [Bacteroidia bacterium]